MGTVGHSTVEVAFDCLSALHISGGTRERMNPQFLLKTYHSHNLPTHTTLRDDSHQPRCARHRVLRTRVARCCARSRLASQGRMEGLLYGEAHRDDELAGEGWL
jgi:hypothetical protein